MSFFQDSLFDPPEQVKISVNQTHELVRLTHLIPWGTLITLAMEIRSKQVKRESGPQPHYRQLLGALALIAVRNLNYREAEDQIAHYAPARYLCDLMDSDWCIDHVTIFDFGKMLGSEGIQAINNQILAIATKNGLADPSILMSDTTAQEAMIPYPTETGLMARYMELMGKGIKKVAGKFQSVKSEVKKAAVQVKNLLRNSNLFAKTKEQKRKVGKKMYHTVKAVHEQVSNLLNTGHSLSSKAGKEITRLTNVMEKLLPQMLHFLETGFVAAKKVIHLQMPELYAITRGKAGKQVEFGLKWGINRIGGGFLQGFLIGGGEHRSDKAFCLEGVDRHLAVFGNPPEIFGFDRGGYSRSNIKKLQRAGIRYVGVAPKGKDEWSVGKQLQEKIKRERAQVEGSIGSIKSNRYGFNKPNAKCTEAMHRCGHRSILGFNLMKLTREIGKMQISPT